MILTDPWGIAMAGEPHDAELEIYNGVSNIISSLLKFDAESRLRIYKTVGTFFNFDNPSPGAGREDIPHAVRANDSREPHFSTHEEPPSPKDFLYQKQPDTDAERVACLAYYMAHFRATPHFKGIDISKLNTEAAQIKFSNPSHAIWNATRNGLLAAAPKGMKQLSAHGERYVDALPDRAAVEELKKAGAPRRSRRPRKNPLEDKNDTPN